MNNLISVCIATYKRPELLEKLLISLLNQKKIDEYNLEFIVVDNDVNKSAEPVIEKFKNLIKDNPRFSLKYDMQPEKNIALTRNKTVELATGNYNFFIDDDEYADELCIYHHLNTLNKFNADVTIGNVLPYFESSVLEYIKNAYPFIRKNSGDGDSTKYLITANAMIFLKKLKKELIVFNPEYGITGGSDNELFIKLHSLGAQIISCSSALAFEFIPSHRANSKWLIRRVFRTGNNYTRTLLQNTNNSFYKFIIGMTQFVKGLLQFIIALILSLIFFPVSRSKSFNWLLKSVSNLSKPFAVFGYYPKEYKE